MPLDVPTWQRFAPAQLASGGLGPHIRMMSAMAASSFDSKIERAWFLGCYIGPYVPTTGFFVWQNFPAPSFDADKLADWLVSNNGGLPVRKGDRRAVSSPLKLGAFYQSYANWIRHGVNWDASYDELWESAEKYLRYAGRFTIIKLLEALRQAGVIEADLTTGIQAAGAQSGPRKALQQICDSMGIQADLASTNNTPTKCAEVNRAARWAETLLIDCPPLSWFQLEGMLCDARQAVKGRYPGRALDEDLEFHQKVCAYWQTDWDGFYQWRAHLFPATSLGEVGGWQGKREVLEKEWTQ